MSDDAKPDVIGIERDAEVQVRTKRVIMCPRCGEGDHGIDHLIDTDGPSHWGAWYCDACGCGFAGTTYPDGRTTVRIVRDEKRPTRVLLRLNPTDKPIHIEVEGMRFSGYAGDKGPTEDEGHARYFYEEHTCAVNFLRQAVETWHGTEPDPHGLFTFVRMVDAPEDDDARSFDVDSFALPATDPKGQT